MQRGASVKARGVPPGIWETLAVAFSALLVAPLPVLLPVAVDAYLSLGPRFSPAALTDPLSRFFGEQAALGQPQAADAAAFLAPLGRSADLAAAVGWFVPSLLAGADRIGLPGAAVRAAVVPGSAGAVLGLGLAFGLLGIFGSMLFRVLLGRIVREAPLLDARLAGDALRATLRYLGFLGLALGLGLAVGGPTVIAAAVLLYVGIDVLPLVGLVATLAALVVSVAIAFVAEAIALVGVGPIAALRLSIGVARRALLPTVGLLLVLLTLDFALPQPLAPLTASGLGLAAAIAVYAVVMTGAALARMQFFADRLPSSEPGVRSR